METETTFQQFSHTGLIIQAGEGGPAIIRRTLAKKGDKACSIYQPTFWIRCARITSTIPALLEKIDKDEESPGISHAIWDNWEHSRPIGEIPLRHPENSKICGMVSLHVLTLQMTQEELMKEIRPSEKYDFIPFEPANLASHADEFEIDGGEDSLLQTVEVRKIIGELLGKAFLRAKSAVAATSTIAETSAVADQQK